jgi:hypothetical protein
MGPRPGEGFVYRAVTDAIREEDLPGLYEKRGRTRRFRRGWFSAFAPLAAAVAVVVAIGVGYAVPKLVSSPGAPRPRPAPSYAPVPLTAARVR